MKTKLLKKLRATGRCMINIHSVTTCGGTVTGLENGGKVDFLLVY